MKHKGQFKKGYIPSNFRHGLSHTKIYYVWQALRFRCLKITNKDFIDYGGRGISFDPKWNDFMVFLKDMGSTYKKGLELDRIDNNGNYCKDNCRWIDKITQRNNKRNNHFIEFNGEKLTLAQWARKIDINYSTLRSRVRRGKKINEIFSICK